MGPIPVVHVLKIVFIFKNVLFYNFEKYNTYVCMTCMEIMLGSSSYKIHQSDVILKCNQSKRFHYQMKQHSMDHNQTFFLTEMSNFFHLTLSNVLSNVHVPKDFLILTILNP